MLYTVDTARLLAQTYPNTTALTASAMNLTTLITPLALVATAFAQGAIELSLTAVNKQTLELRQAVETWKGDLLGTIPILKSNTNIILVSIKKGTKAAQDSQPLDFLGALGVAVATKSLPQSVNTTLTALVTGKPKFDKLLLSPAILINLGLQKSATAEMSKAILEKIPAYLRSIAEELIRLIDVAFELAIRRLHF